MYCSRGVDWPVFSSNSGVPPAYMVPGGSPNGFNPFAASCRSRHDSAASGGGASWRQGAASRASRVAQRVIAAILPGRTEERQMTPLLRWGNAVLKLELFRPRGAVSDRAPPPADGAELTGNQALSFARHGGELALRGVVTHEMREALRLWGTRIKPRGEPWKPDPAVFARTGGAGLVAQLLAPPLFVVCPAGAVAALLGIVSALRQRWPAVRGVTLVAPGEELPDLPRSADLPSEIERVAVTRADAAAARARVARELGLLAGHAGAAAAVWAHEHGGVAIVSGPGGREFTLDVSP